MTKAPMNPRVRELARKSAAMCGDGCCISEPLRKGFENGYRQAVEDCTQIADEELGSLCDERDEYSSSSNLYAMVMGGVDTAQRMLEAIKALLSEPDEASGGTEKCCSCHGCCDDEHGCLHKYCGRHRAEKAWLSKVIGNSENT